MDEEILRRVHEICIITGGKPCTDKTGLEKCDSDNCYIFELLTLGHKDCELEMEAAGFRQP